MSENNLINAVENAATEAALYPPLPGATFKQAIQRFFKKYTVFNGRASRSEYWWVQLFIYLVTMALSILLVPGAKTDANGDVQFNFWGYIVIAALIAWGLFIIVPSLALLWRRLHDANFSGWFYLLNLIPGGSFVIFIFTLLPSNPAGIRFDQPQL